MKRVLPLGAFVLLAVVVGGFFAARQVAQSSNTVGTSSLMPAESQNQIVPPPDQDPGYSIAIGGPSEVSGGAGGTLHSADLLAGLAPVGPGVVYPCADTGLGFCGAAAPHDDIDALSYGGDFTWPMKPYWKWLFFSVAPGSTGAAGTGVNAEATCPPASEPEADEFWSSAHPALNTNGLYYDGDAVDCNSGAPIPGFGLVEPGDDLDALDEFPAPVIQVPGGFLAYGSIDAFSPSVVPGLLDPGDVLWTVLPPIPGGGNGGFGVYADDVNALGLDPSHTDDLDALCLLDVFGDDYYNPAQGDVIWFSLTPNSPTVTGSAGAISAADILMPAPPGPPVVVVQESAIGLLTSDDLNALKCAQIGDEADKAVTDIVFDDATGYPYDGPPLPPHPTKGLPYVEVPADEQVVISVTSVEENWGPGEPTDALVGFYADIPPTCEGRWFDAGALAGGPPDFPWDFYTVGGDPYADPFSPEQLGEEDLDPLIKKPGDVDGELGQPDTFEVDLHFQTLDYGIDEPYTDPPTQVPITRFFDLGCPTPGQYHFWFCNKVEPKDLIDPDLTNNVWCEEMVVESLETPTPTPTPTEVPPPSLDHFKCYDAFGNLSGGPVTLADQFGTDTAFADRSLYFCNPADKLEDGIPMKDPDAHLECYAIISPGEPFVPRDVEVTNQFGTETLRVVEPQLLCLPTQKEGHPAPVGLDHYKCYDVQVLEGSDPPPSVTLEDQWGTQVVDVFGPRFLCTPVDKLEDQDPIFNPDDHLVCYAIVPPGVSPRTINVSNQFGDEVLDVGWGSWLCLPSSKTVLPTATPTATNTPTRTSTPTATATPTEVPPAPQDPTFSISSGSVQAPVPVDPADLVVRSPGGVPPPTVVWPCPALLPPGMWCGSTGALPPWDDVNALSLGRDFILPPPDPVDPNAYIYFSVGPGANGVPGTGVNNETVGCITGIPEPEADEFGSAGTGSNYQYFDGDGFPSCMNPPAAPLGLIEPLGDDLDAVDPLNLAAVGPPIFVSLDATSPTITTAPPGMLSAGDIFFDMGAGIAGWYAPAGALGLDTLGWNTDDIDGVCINDADGDLTYSPGDTVWFSLRAGSASLGIAGDSPADVFAAPFVPGNPVRTAAQLGLLPGDELNALKCYEVPPCTDREGDTACDDPVNDGDDDGCVDAEELAGAPAPKPGSTGAYDPTAWYDFYDVPVPAKPDSGPGSGANGVRSKSVTMADVLAVLFYVGAKDNADPNGNGVDYDTIKGVDLDGDTTNDIPPPLHAIEEGVKYDRSPSTPPDPPWAAGPPSGAVNMADVLAVLAQVGLSCSGPP